MCSSWLCPDPLGPWERGKAEEEQTWSCGAEETQILVTGSLGVTNYPLIQSGECVTHQVLGYSQHVYQQVQARQRGTCCQNLQSWATLALALQLVILFPWHMSPGAQVETYRGLAQE